MKIEIDKESGFCYGVVRAVERAESYLNDPEAKRNPLYSIGSMVHNSAELERLKELGLRVIDSGELNTLKNSTVLIRAHGEPPHTYETAHKNRLKIIDCTCPVVIKLQELIRSTHQKIGDQGGQIVIFGKHEHAEVNGLVGQTEGKAIVVEDIEDFEKAVNSGLISLDKDIYLFAQTTKNSDEYLRLKQYIDRIFSQFADCNTKGALHAFNTICSKVSSRHHHLEKFAAEHSVILFISGKESSNGKVLFEICRSVNPRSYLIEKSDEIDPAWFREDDNVGICGANSTPRWQLESVERELITIYK